MSTKPVSPAMHGIIDYTFSAALLTLPHIIKLNKKLKWLYAADAVNTALYSILTNYPLSIKHIIHYRTHRKLDIENIVALALATLYKPVRKSRRALGFHISIITAALLTVLLTDWKVKNASLQAGAPGTLLPA